MIIFSIVVGAATIVSAIFGVCSLIISVRSKKKK